MAHLFKLKRILSRMDSAVLAYSGGVDSVFLAAVAGEALKGRLLAVTADSPTYPPEELRFARSMAARLGVKHLVIKTREIKHGKFFSNPPDRCYYCKRVLFSALHSIADKRGISCVIDASSLSDKKDYRPGSRAKKELGVRSPLQEAGFDKEDIRKESRRMGLPTWNKPAMACLASRVPYGTPLEPGLLKRINRAEQALAEMGLPGARLRHYGSLCRIETAPVYFKTILKKRKRVVSILKRAGYRHITFDLQGYRQGSMNLDI